jgi:hypothetical protein
VRVRRSKQKQGKVPCRYGWEEQVDVRSMRDRGCEGRWVCSVVVDGRDEQRAPDFRVSAPARRGTDSLDASPVHEPALEACTLHSTRSSLPDLSRSGSDVAVLPGRLRNQQADRNKASKIVDAARAVRGEGLVR